MRVKSNSCILCLILNIPNEFGEAWLRSKEMTTYFRNSRWRPPPSWISKMCYHFFTIGPMLTKFVGNVENLTKNAIVRSKMHIYLNWRMAAITILNFENRLPFLYYWTNPPHIWWDCWESDKERYCLFKNAYIPKFKMAPFWISKLCCYFFTIESILTKFGGFVENLTKNATVTFKLHIYPNLRWRPKCNL